MTLNDLSKDQLKYALRESVQLQAHYAGLLNMYDQGKRIQFKNAEEWVEHLLLMRKKIPKRDSVGKPICSVCNDTHLMDFFHGNHDEFSRKVMCTSCPTPCDKCRSNGYGPYCTETPCSCECHRYCE